MEKHVHVLLCQNGTYDIRQVNPKTSNMDDPSILFTFQLNELNVANKVLQEMNVARQLDSPDIFVA